MCKVIVQSNASIHWRVKTKHPNAQFSSKPVDNEIKLHAGAYQVAWNTVIYVIWTSATIIMMLLSMMYRGLSKSDGRFAFWEQYRTVYAGYLPPILLRVSEEMYQLK
ncbi:hypothetical protein DFP73DRAFT_527149 [Morchella snyderi]|nr:hypothetical protein DFP73DRAFT_527149 [Morchella snyderi]